MNILINLVLIGLGIMLFNLLILITIRLTNIKPIRINCEKKDNKSEYYVDYDATWRKYFIIKYEYKYVPLSFTNLYLFIPLTAIFETVSEVRSNFRSSIYSESVVEKLSQEDIEKLYEDEYKLHLEKLKHMRVTKDRINKLMKK